jgi:ABC-type branched-subunit amino acid transport system substrate-binding protein
MRPTNTCHRQWHRRDIIKLLGATAVAGPAILRGTAAKATTSKLIKIGLVSPRTGRAAGFGEPDGYVLGLARKALASGLTIGGKKYDVQVIDKDGQSNPQRGAQVANDLINADGVDLMLTTSTPERSIRWVPTFYEGRDSLCRNQPNRAGPGDAWRNPFWSSI